MSEQLSSTDKEHKKHEAVEVVINGKHYRFRDDDVTGGQIKESAGIPADHALYRRHPGENEPIPDDEQVELQDGDHFFSRPPSNVS